MTIRRLAEEQRLSGAVTAGGMVWLAGQVADDATLDAEGQTADILRQIDALLAEAGTDKRALVSVTVVLTDIRDAAAMNRAWDAWVAERAAPAVPGAADFIRAARAMKDAAGRPVRVFFITNRECSPRAGSTDPCPQHEDTLANLRALGLDATALAEDLMLKGERADWPSEKESRRQEVARSHRIVLNVGDDFGDFLPGVRRQSVAARERARCAHADFWGARWFLLPNPMYGSWLVALGPDFDGALAEEPAPSGDCPRN